MQRDMVRPWLRSNMNATIDGNNPTARVMNVGSATMNKSTAEATTDKPENALFFLRPPDCLAIPVPYHICIRNSAETVSSAIMVDAKAAACWPTFSASSSRAGPDDSRSKTSLSASEYSSTAVMNSV